MLSRKKVRNRKSLVKYRRGDLLLTRRTADDEPIIGMIIDVGIVLYRVEWYDKITGVNIMHYAEYAVKLYRNAFIEYIKNDNSSNRSSTN